MPDGSPDDDSNLRNATLTKIRTLTEEELDREYWTDLVRDDEFVVALEFSNGETLFPSANEAGDSPGIFCSCLSPETTPLEPGMEVTGLWTMDTDEIVQEKYGWVQTPEHILATSLIIEFDDRHRVFSANSTDFNSPGVIFGETQDGELIRRW